MKELESFPKGKKENNPEKSKEEKTGENKEEIERGIETKKELRIEEKIKKEREIFSDIIEQLRIPKEEGVLDEDFEAVDQEKIEEKLRRIKKKMEDCRQKIGKDLEYFENVVFPEIDNFKIGPEMSSLEFDKFLRKAKSIQDDIYKNFNKSLSLHRLYQRGLEVLKSKKLEDLGVGSVEELSRRREEEIRKINNLKSRFLGFLRNRKEIREAKNKIKEFGRVEAEVCRFEKDIPNRPSLSLRAQRLLEKANTAEVSAGFRFLTLYFDNWIKKTEKEQGRKILEEDILRQLDLDLINQRIKEAEREAKRLGKGFKNPSEEEIERCLSLIKKGPSLLNRKEIKKLPLYLAQLIGTDYYNKTIHRRFEEMAEIVPRESFGEGGRVKQLYAELLERLLNEVVKGKKVPVRTRLLGQEIQEKLNSLQFRSIGDKIFMEDFISTLDPQMWSVFFENKEVQKKFGIENLERANRKIAQLLAEKMLESEGAKQNTYAFYLSYFKEPCSVEPLYLLGLKNIDSSSTAMKTLKFLTQDETFIKRLERYKEKGEYFDRIINLVKSVSKGPNDYDYYHRLAWKDEKLAKEFLSCFLRKDIENLEKNYGISIKTNEELKILSRFSKPERERMSLKSFQRGIAAVSQNYGIKIDHIKRLQEFVSVFTPEELEKISSPEFLKILDLLRVKQRDISTLRLLTRMSFSEEEWKKIFERRFDKGIREKLIPLIKRSYFYGYISSEIIKTLEKKMSKKWYLIFSREMAEYISSSLTFSYLSLEKPNKETLERLQEKAEKSAGEEKKEAKKILGAIMQDDFHLSRVIPGWKKLKKYTRSGNVNYLSLSKKMGIPFDMFGITGEDLEGIKRLVDKKAEEIIEGYKQNKERYLPYLDSLLGYGTRYRNWMCEILKIDNLWDFKTSRLDNNLKDILNRIKEIKMKTGENKSKEKNKRKEKNIIDDYLDYLEDHLRAEKFFGARERIGLIKEENREKALQLIDKMEEVIALFRENKLPQKKIIDVLSSNKPILKNLGLSLTLESIKMIFRKLSEPQEKEVNADVVEILKKPEEYLSAMDKEPSCMRSEGQYSYGALVITQGPIFIIGVLDKNKKIIARSLLIPVKDKKGKWRFELKSTYPLGSAEEEEIKKFAQGAIERTLREEKKGYYRETNEIVSLKPIEGELPKTKAVSSTSRLSFWRDEVGLTRLEKIDQN